ncbi:MAG: hypothetical protein ACW99Q_17360 [Candidatus Kariarchaeaceae archaeon]|jgi:hypothetical protein
MANSISMFYGDYEFSPVPFVTLNKVYDRRGDDVKVGVTYNLNLRGWLVGIGSGVDGMITLQRELRDAIATDGDYFRIICDSNVILECFPRPENLQFDEGEHRWMDECPFSIDFNYYVEPVNEGVGGFGEDTAVFPPHIKSATETWEVEPVPEANYYLFNHSAGTDSPPYQLRVAHNVAAVGKTYYNDSGVIRKEAWEEARDYIIPLLGYDADKTLGSGTFNFAIDNWGEYNHMRVQSIDENQGSFSVNETWLAINTGVAWHNSSVTESFNIQARTLREQVRSYVTINGSIQGLETRSYGSNPGDFTISQDKYAAASGYWETVKDSIRIYPRANVVAQREGFTLNVNPITKIEGHNPHQGIITYSYEYDDKPSNCISGAKTETIIVNDSHPTDVFAQILVLGRGQGPILQDLGTVTNFVREVQISAIMSGNDICPNDSITNFLTVNNPSSDVDNILCQFLLDLSGTYGQVFKHSDNESWNPKEGFYSRSVGWTATDCSNEPNTSFC